MDIKQEIDLQIWYGIGSVNINDIINNKQYSEDFITFIPFTYLYFSKRAEKKAIDKAMKHISKTIFENHQQLMK